MTGLVFAMALSFLGVWEIPIPGFVGSRAGRPIAGARKGPAGPFSRAFSPRSWPRRAADLSWARLRLPPHPAAARGLLHLRRRRAWAWPRRILSWAYFPELLAVSAPARRVDGNLQAGHGLPAPGHGGLPLHNAQRGLLHPHADAAGRPLVCRMADRPHAADGLSPATGACLGGGHCRGRRRGRVRLHHPPARAADRLAALLRRGVENGPGRGKDGHGRFLGQLVSDVQGEPPFRRRTRRRSPRWSSGTG